MAREEPPVTRGGVTITDEVADELAREAEAGHEIDPTRVHRAGRKSLAGGSGKSPRVNFRMPQELYDRAVEMAGETGRSVSDVAREALERHVRRHTRRP
jgi:predicted HicB family RNase H-like nuclease